MVSNDNFQRALDLINKSTNILITTHTKPDGDSCGCMVAISEWLTSIGKKTHQLLLSAVPQWYEFLFLQKPAILGEDITIAQLSEGVFADIDLVIIVDTNSYSQLPEFEDYLEINEQPVLVIDHHVTTDGLGDVEIIDSSAAAAGLIVFELLKYAKAKLTAETAQALFVAAATDTGWFQFNNTDGRVYRTCAELVDIGIEPAEMYRLLYHNYSPQRMKLMTVMFDSLELHFHGRYATQSLLKSDFEQTEAAYADTENLIDECRKIRTVEAAALFVELANRRIKCSLRSRGSLDVSKIAKKFGGGGHKNAAGITFTRSMEEAKQLILAEMEKHFSNIVKS